MQRVPFVGRACCLCFGGVPVVCRGCSTSPALYWGHPTSPVRCWERPISCTGSFVFSCFCGRTAGRCVAVGGMSNCWGNVGWRGALLGRRLGALMWTSIHSHRSLRVCASVRSALCAACAPVAAAGRCKDCVAGEVGTGRCRNGGFAPSHSCLRLRLTLLASSAISCFYQTVEEKEKNTSADNPKTVSRCGESEAGSLT